VSTQWTTRVLFLLGFRATPVVKISLAATTHKPGKVCYLRLCFFNLARRPNLVLLNQKCFVNSRHRDLDGQKVSALTKKNNEHIFISQKVSHQTLYFSLVCRASSASARPRLHIQVFRACRSACPRATRPQRVAPPALGAVGRPVRAQVFSVVST
jgi:hypothetical protein